VFDVDVDLVVFEFFVSEEVFNVVGGLWFDGKVLLLSSV
jgi:hypothetical protein